MFPIGKSARSNLILYPSQIRDGRFSHVQLPPTSPFALFQGGCRTITSVLLSPSSSLSDLTPFHPCVAVLPAFVFTYDLKSVFIFRHSRITLSSSPCLFFLRMVLVLEFATWFPSISAAAVDCRCAGYRTNLSSRTNFHAGISCAVVLCYL